MARTDHDELRVTMDNRQRPSTSLPLTAALGLFVTAVCAQAATFEEQRAAISPAVESQPEAAIVSLLESGIESNHPAQAVTLAEGWLRQNLPKDAKLLYLAGRAAELSGDWTSAATFYEQFLKTADPKSKDTDDAVIGAFAIRVDNLNDTAGAYSFGRSAPQGLSANPRFRQLDRWFLDQARGRNAKEDVVNRLLSTVKAGVSEDLIIALYERDFRWLLDSIRGVRYDQLTDRFTPELVSKVQELASASPIDEELKLLLDWSVSVKAYNMARIDGKEAAAPVDKAKALLEKFPSHALLVQTDWAGGSNSQHYRDDPKKYWPHELEAKMASIRAALPKLTPHEQAELVQSWSNGHYSTGPEVLTTEEARALVLEKPELVNHKSGPKLNLKWNELEFEQAKKLAANLANNPSPEASMVRAVAAAGADKDLAKAMDALLGPELWRLGKADLSGRYADLLWHWAGKPGDNTRRDQEIARLKAVAGQIPADEANAKKPDAQRLNAFKTLWNDFRSGQPKLPAVRERLASVIRVSPEAVVQLLRDPSVEAQILVSEALAAGIDDSKGPLSREPAVRGLSPGRYDPIYLRLFDRHRQSVDYLKKQGMYQAYPLLPAIQQAFADGLKKNQLSPWLAMTWLNAQFPEGNEESVKLMEELFKSPAWKALPTDVRFGMRQWFGEKAMTPAEFAHIRASDPAVISSALLEIPAFDKKAKEPQEPIDIAIATAVLAKAIEGLRNAPVRVDIQGLDRIAHVKAGAFEDPDFLKLIVELADSIRSSAVDESVGNRLLNQLAKQRDPAMLLRTSAYLWLHVERFHRPFAGVMELAESLIDDQPEAASALALAGLATIDRHKTGHTWFKSETLWHYFYPGWVSNRFVSWF